MFEKKPSKHLPDRPLECGECKKPVAVRYTEIAGNSVTHTSLCADCPELQRRLYGIDTAETIANQTETVAGLGCGNCGTTLEEIKRGHRLGCAECYSVFEDALIGEMQAFDSLPARFSSSKKNLPLHIGRAPGEILSVNASSRLLALDEALRETLNREDYEQAAWIRDQIKALTDRDKSDKSNEEKENEHI